MYGVSPGSRGPGTPALGGYVLFRLAQTGGLTFSLRAHNSARRLNETCRGRCSLASGAERFIDLPFDLLPERQVGGHPRRDRHQVGAQLAGEFVDHGHRGLLRLDNVRLLSALDPERDFLCARVLHLACRQYPRRTPIIGAKPSNVSQPTGIDLIAAVAQLRQNTLGSELRHALFREVQMLAECRG